MINEKIHHQSLHDYTEIQYSLNLAYRDISSDEEIEGEGIRLEKVAEP